MKRCYFYLCQAFNSRSIYIERKIDLISNKFTDKSCDSKIKTAVEEHI